MNELFSLRSDLVPFAAQVVGYGSRVDHVKRDVAEKYDAQRQSTVGAAIDAFAGVKLVLGASNTVLAQAGSKLDLTSGPLIM